MIRRLGQRVRLPVRLRRRDDGAILIIALLAVTVVSLVVGVVLTRGDGSLRATVQLRQVAGSSYAADGAAKLALNALRTGYSPGDPNGAAADSDWAFNNSFDGTGCFGKDGSGTAVSTLVLPGFYPQTGGQSSATSAAVTCTAEDATGAQGSPVPITDGNKPGSAILTLGTSGETGFYSKALGGNSFRVHGGIWSNSTIVADTGALVSSQSIRAHSGCTGTMTAPTVECSAATVADPGYASDLDIAGTGIPALQTVPSCSGNLATFEPGYYDDVAALNALTTPNANKNCVYWLKPGTYYFDFHNNSVDPLHDDDIAAAASDEWTISSGTLIAGTRTGTSTVPGACDNPIDKTTANGVQLVFGGDSRMLIDKDGQAEICGSYHADRPPIAIYGQKTGTTPSATTLSGTTALTSSGNATTDMKVGTVAPATVTAAILKDVGNGQMTWTRDNTGANSVQTGTVTMTGFAPTTAIPKGAVLTGLKAFVRHQEGTSTAGNASEISVTPTGSGTTLKSSSALTVRTTLGNDTQDLSAATGFGTVQKYVHDSGFSGATVVFTAKLPRSGSSTTTIQSILDAVQLELTYYVPGIRGETTTAIPNNCVAVVASCSVVTTSGNKSILYVQGTHYTPLAKVDVTLNNVSQQIFRFGVIARAIEVKETGSFAWTGPVIELPDNSPGWGFSGTLVQLKVYLCPSAATCSPSTGELSLKVRAQLWDTTGTPRPPSRQVTVLSWSEQR
ncbi:hypothetical protein [Nocardioides sp. MH1]|uniref:hypothetical protein n=1 Tax=Nocardioides sp. MH1 TaxID=3242490 RepID=UPI00352169FB